MFTTGQRIKITTEAHAYTCGGITDPNTIVPQEVVFATVRRVTGKTLSVEYENHFAKRGRIRLNKLSSKTKVEAA